MNETAHILCKHYAECLKPFHEQGTHSILVTINIMKIGSYQILNQQKRSEA